MTNRRLPKPFAILIAALMALYFVPLAALPASADTVGGFEIEGDLADDPAVSGIDWASVDTTSTDFATDVDHTTGGQDATTFGGGSKEYNDGGQNGWPAWVYGGGNAPGKSDFGRWATYTNTDASSHVWLFLGFDRDFAQGTAKYAFELNQIIQSNVDNPNTTRSQGDLRFIVWDQGNGKITLTGDDKNGDVGLYKWIDPDQAVDGVAADTDNDGHWVKNETNGTFIGAVNSAPVAVPSWWTSKNVASGMLGTDKFVEFGVDLTSFGAVLGCPSSGFSAVNARSITGTGVTGELVDYLSALPVHIPSTCTSLVTEATDQVVVGGGIMDTATITPSAATGTVTFTVYGPDDATCANAPVKTFAPVAVVDGKAASGVYVPTLVGTYRWIASYDSNDEAHYADSVGECNDPHEVSVVVKRQPGISTDAKDGAQLLSNDPSINDVATVTNLTADAGGTVTFTVYGPNDSDCSGTVKFDNTKSLGTVSNGTAVVTSDDYTPTAAGTYRWIASYSGDASNKAVSGACNGADESSVVEKTSPTIITDADDTAKLPYDATVSDTATLGGVTENAGGTITFKLFGPDTTPGTPTCDESVTGNLVFTSEAFGVDGPGDYGPVSTSVSQAGTYFWVAYYSGDDDNSAVAGVCGDTTETSDVDQASPAITTTASDAALPQQSSISDTAHLTDLTSDATGKVTFNVWGPFADDSAATCTGEPFGTKVVDLPTVGDDHAADVSSGAVVVDTAGTYFWVASYAGDANNAAVTGSCGDKNETSVVTKGQPSISTVASADDDTLPGTAVKDTANLAGLTANATGTITFTIYRNVSCTTVETTLNEVAIGTVTGGKASATSSSYTDLVNAGTYYFIASYSGDANNKAVSGTCGDDNESVTITKGQPSISTVASADDDTLPGTAVKDTANLAGLTANATGTVTFTIYSNVSCTTVVTTLNEVPIGTVTGGKSSATSSSYTDLVNAGTYYFIASYSGDANNKAVSGTCGDDNESVTIKAGDKPGLDKFSNPVSGSSVQPGSTIHYSVKVFNTGDVAITNEDVIDVLPAHVTVVVSTISDGGVLDAAKGQITWKTTLAPGGQHTFTYDATVNADAPQGDLLVNTAKFRNLQDTTTHVVPSGKLAITKAVSPVAGNGVLVEFGDTLTYTLTVSATGGLNQPNVVVTDLLPGRDPAHPKSGDTSYVAGTAKCIGAGTCTVTGPDANGLITWHVGDMAAGSTRQVTFQVTIDDVRSGNPGETVAVDIINQGAVRSDRTPTTPSNVVVTPVSKVLPVKIPRELPHTGAILLGRAAGGAVLLLGLGMLLMVSSRRRNGQHQA